MEYIQNPKSQGDTEVLIQTIDNKIESLKTKYNLFFSGEIRIPPEQEREELQKQVRNIVHTGKKNPRLALLTQNVSSKFSLYNNMWLKRLNEIESGIIRNPRKPIVNIEKKIEKPKKNTPIAVSLNREDSFDQFYDKYKKLSLEQSEKIVEKEKMINSIKTKLITSNLIDVKIDFQIENGKVKLKIKKHNFV